MLEKKVINRTADDSDANSVCIFKTDDGFQYTYATPSSIVFFTLEGDMVPMDVKDPDSPIISDIEDIIGNDYDILISYAQDGKIFYTSIDDCGDLGSIVEISNGRAVAADNAKPINISSYYQLDYDMVDEAMDELCDFTNVEEALYFFNISLD